MNLHLVKLQIILISSSLLLSSCFDKEEKVILYKNAKAKKSSRDVRVPNILEKKIDEAFKKYLEDLKQESDSKPEREYLDITVKFSQEKNGPLLDNLKFFLPRGGGVIDLSESVMSDQGDFKMQIELNKNSEPDFKIEDPRVYFASHSRKREIGGESHGSGCGSLVLLQKAKSLFIDKSLDLNASHAKYLSVLAGDMYFTYFEPKKIYIAVMSITDSRHPQHLCSTSRNN